MRYLRMLSNAIAAAALASAYVLVLLLHQNTRVPLDPARLAPIAQGFGLFYGVHLTAIFYAVLVARQLLAREVFSPAWVSIGVLSGLGAAAAAAGSLLMLLNVRSFALVLQPDTIGAMRWTAFVLGVSSALFVLLAVARRSGGPRLRPLWAVLTVGVAVGSVAVPLLVRAHEGEPPSDTRPLIAAVDGPAHESSSRIAVVAIDAGSLDLITSATAEGRLPNFGRILDGGAVMRLATLHPTSAEAIWTAVATGKLPQKNGVRSAAVYRAGQRGDPIRLLPDFCFASGLVRFGVLAEEPLTSASIRARPVWTILSLQGVNVGVVNWPLTYPAPAVRGFLVSDGYLRRTSTLSGLDDPLVAYPPDLPGQLAQIVHAGDSEAPLRQDAVHGALQERHKIPGRSDRVYGHMAHAVSQTYPAQVTIVRYESLDPIGHYFLRYAVPYEFGDVTDEERRRFGAVLEGHYGQIDEAIGRAIAALGPDDLLLVVSGYGLEPLSLGKRLLERVMGDPDISGTHEAAPDGFLMAYGAAVARARLPHRASVVDVAPTILYFLGLPIGRDMDGYARTDLFVRDFTEEHPITFIPTYER
jgi:predicted AlkP superfamily phosphohydrolase/phosphomutase